MSGVTIAWLSIILGTLVSLVADTFFGFSAKNGQGYDLKWFLLGWVIYGISAIGWVIAYKHEKFAIVATIYSVFLLIFSVVIGYLVFKEKLSSAQIVGILLGLVSLVLLKS